MSNLFNVFSFKKTDRDQLEIGDPIFSDGDTTAVPIGFVSDDDQQIITCILFDPHHVLEDVSEYNFQEELLTSEQIEEKFENAQLYASSEAKNYWEAFSNAIGEGLEHLLHDHEHDDEHQHTQYH